MYWLKLAHGAPANPKWRAIANKVGCPTGHVWTLYTWVLDFAGQHNGSLTGFDLDEVAAGTDYPLDELARIWAEFVAKLIVAGDAVKNWAKHQGIAAVNAAHAAAAKVERAVANSAARMRRKRDRDRQNARQGDLFGASHPGVTCDAVTGPPPAPPPREYIKTKTPPGPPPPGEGARRAFGSQIAGWEGRPASQAEILLPLAGRRWRDLSPAERRSAQRNAAIAEGVARVEARQRWEAEHGRAA